MNKELIVSTTPQETRVALLEDGVVAELFIEREAHRGHVGNIYRGRVTRVLPGMQSAFVDIGLERDAFLYVEDVLAQLEAEEAEADKREAAPPAEAEAPGVPAAEPPAGTAPPAPSAGTHSRREPADAELPIEERLREGQEVVVQVVKEPLGTKGARITSHVSLPGRYLVFMPTVEHVGVSRKITEDDERRRLKGILRELRQERGGGGLIARTVSQGRTREDLERDAQYLARTWDEVRARGGRERPPALLHREPSLVQRLLRDLLSDDMSAIRLDNEKERQRTAELVGQLQPELLPRVHFHQGPLGILEEHGVASEIERALKPKVWLESGGYIVINQTEALVAIDVNTGRYTGKKTLEETILKTNLEAVKEIVRQIRLRDLGGIVVIDFIDMEERKSRQKVMGALEQELRRDRSPSKMLSVHEFGLAILTRKRVRQSLERTLCQTCPYCTGSGMIKSVATVCAEIYDEVRKLAEDLRGQRLLLRVNPEVARALDGEEASLLRQLGTLVGEQIVVQGDPLLHQEQFDVVPR
ncbi:MAG TPA: Rne/Rng family ribonuclease [Vicinamibacteria bacterium]|nr:Rne/Rng family ribonuclease [Vicinamibacteria bacterium]